MKGGPFAAQMESPFKVKRAKSAIVGETCARSADSTPGAGVQVIERGIAGSTVTRPARMTGVNHPPAVSGSWTVMQQIGSIVPLVIAMSIGESKKMLMPWAKSWTLNVPPLKGSGVPLTELILVTWIAGFDRD